MRRAELRVNNCQCVQGRAVRVSIKAEKGYGWSWRRRRGAPSSGVCRQPRDGKDRAVVHRSAFGEARGDWKASSERLSPRDLLNPRKMDLCFKAKRLGVISNGRRHLSLSAAELC